VALLDVVRVESDVAAVQDAVLRRADVDEGRFHPGEHVLDLAEVDIAVDRRVVGFERSDVVLDQAAPLEDGDVGGAILPDVHGPLVPPRRASLAGPPPSAFQRSVVVLVERDGGVDGADVAAHRFRHRCRRAGVAAAGAASTATAPPPTAPAGGAAPVAAARRGRARVPDLRLFPPPRPGPRPPPRGRPARPRPPRPRRPPPPPPPPPRRRP